MSEVDPARHDAILQQVTHKPAEWLAYERAVVEACCRGWLAGRREFAADDVPLDLRPDNQGMSGNVWHGLVRANILEPVYCLDFAQIKRRRSTAESAKSRWVNCYRLTSFEQGASWLAKHGGPVLRPQMELAL